MISPAVISPAVILRQNKKNGPAKSPAQLRDVVTPTLLRPIHTLFAVGEAFLNVFLVQDGPLPRIAAAEPIAM